MKTAWPIWVFDEVGRTRRSVLTLGADMPSSIAARAPTVGFS